VKKYYVGILDGELAAAGQWIDSLARLKNERRTIKAGAQGKKAVTFVFPLIRRDGHSLCFFSIQTGRTHQIRTQAALQGHPLSGDRKYGSATAMDRYVLHCLAVVFPQDGQVDFPPPLIAGLPRDSERETLRIFGASSLGLIEEAVRKALPG
jgi:23S rRNA pseudouridine955/2504/2580 synthase